MSSVLHKLSKDIGKIEAQLHAFYHKYGINSIKDLEHAIEKGTVVESDVFEDLTSRYAYHWERRHVDDTIYRWDNAKHEVWKKVKTFPSEIFA